MDVLTDNNVAVDNGQAEPTERKAISVAQIHAAPPDCREEWLEVPEWGGWIKLRSPTALAAAEIKSAGIVLDAETQSASMDLPAGERAQVLHGVIDPALSKEDVAAMQSKFGPAFNSVVKALDKLAGPLGPKDGEEAVRKAAEHSFRAG